MNLAAPFAFEQRQQQTQQQQQQQQHLLVRSIVNSNSNQYDSYLSFSVTFMLVLHWIQYKVRESWNISERIAVEVGGIDKQRLWIHKRLEWAVNQPQSKPICINQHKWAALNDGNKFGLLLLVFLLLSSTLLLLQWRWADVYHDEWPTNLSDRFTKNRCHVTVHSLFKIPTHLFWFHLCLFNFTWLVHFCCCCLCSLWRRGRVVAFRLFALVDCGHGGRHFVSMQRCPAVLKLTTGSLF